MSAIKFVLSYMRGLKLKYLMAIASIALAAFFSFMTPLVMKLTVDSVLGGQKINLPWGLTNFLDQFDTVPFLVKNLWVAGVMIVFIGFIGHSFSYLRGKLSAQCAEEFARRLRNSLYDHIQKLPFAWHSKVQTGDIIQRCTSDIDTVKRFMGSQLVQLGRGVIMVILVIPIMLSLSVKMTLVSIIVIPLIFAYAVIFFRQVRRRFTAADESEGYMTTVLEESLNGIRVVRAFARQDYEIQRFEDAADDYREKCRKLITVLAYYWASSDILCLIQISGVLIFGIYQTINGNISLGTLLAFTTYVGMLLWPIREMGRILTDMGRAQVSIGRLREILDTPQEKLDGYFDLPEDYRVRGKIDFLNVSFAYNEDEEPILRNIDLSIAPGETLAILGSTGAGKSTLVNLIPRLFEYSSGKIRIDGVELRKFDRQQIRRQIGIVLQEPFLYSRTISENIGLAAPGASREMIEKASQEAALHKSIMEFELQYDTVIGENGITLSGGQRQRSAIARALIADPPILILDDSLSAVDSETEREIQQNLLLRKGKATTIIITHRLTTVSIADRILVLEHGKIAQLGTHQELLHSEGPYQRIWNIQHQLESEAI
jgi:ATP-binding cassette subfamily B protein